MGEVGLCTFSRAKRVLTWKRKGLATLSKAFGQTIVRYLEFGFETHVREAQQFEQLDVECTSLIICQSNHRVGVPTFFEDREWRHNLWQSQLCGYHAALVHISFQQWLLNLCKSVHVGGFTPLFSVRRPITLVVFSHPVTHYPSQKIMEGIFCVWGADPPTLQLWQTVSASSRYDSCVRVHIESQSLPSDCENFRAHASVASVRF